MVVSRTKCQSVTLTFFSTPAYCAKKQEYVVVVVSVAVDEVTVAVVVLVVDVVVRPWQVDVSPLTGK